HVTGVQTCALPISHSRRSFAAQPCWTGNARSGLLHQPQSGDAMTDEPAGFMGWLRGLTGGGAPIVPVVRLHGVIAAEQRPGRLNIANVAPLLKRAFDIKAAPAVAVVVNSPGGSPVQSRLIAKRMRDLAV